MKITSPAMPAALAEAPASDSGLRFDHRLIYGDPLLPVDAGAKAKLELATRSDANLLLFAQAHMADMAGNPSFPTPLPTVEAFESVAATLAAAVTAYNNAKTAAKQALALRNTARAAMEAAFNQRRNYVQNASYGDEAVILSSGLPVQAARTPTGELPPPENLRVELSDIAGQMRVAWKAVPGSAGYLLRWAKDEPQPQWNLRHCNRPAHTFRDMEIGQAYVFQVAAAGGANGQSYWSPAVRRTAG